MLTVSTEAWLSAPDKSADAVLPLPWALVAGLRHEEGAHRQLCRCPSLFLFLQPQTTSDSSLLPASCGSPPHMQIKFTR